MYTCTNNVVNPDHMGTDTCMYMVNKLHLTFHVIRGHQGYWISTQFFFSFLVPAVINKIKAGLKTRISHYRDICCISPLLCQTGEKLMSIWAREMLQKWDLATSDYQSSLRMCSQPGRQAQGRVGAIRKAPVWVPGASVGPLFSQGLKTVSRVNKSAQW